MKEVLIELSVQFTGKLVKRVMVEDDVTPEELEKLRQDNALPLVLEGRGIEIDALTRLRHKQGVDFIGTISVAGATSDEIDTRRWRLG